MRGSLSSHKRLAGVSPLSQKTPGRHHIWRLCYWTSNMIFINATLSLDHFLLCLKFTSLFYVYVCVFYELFLSSIMLCSALLCKHVRCHVYFTISLLSCSQMTPKAHLGNQFHRRCILDRRHTCSAVTWIKPTGTPVAVWSLGATHRRTRGVFVTNSWRLVAFVLF